MSQVRNNYRGSEEGFQAMGDKSPKASSKIKKQKTDKKEAAKKK